MPDRASTAPKSPRNRSAVANGTRLIAGVDKNSAAYREYRDVVADLVEHMGSAPTAVQRAIIEDCGIGRLVPQATPGVAPGRGVRR